jgi:hypothetical protein
MCTMEDDHTASWATHEHTSLIPTAYQINTKGTFPLGTGRQNVKLKTYPSNTKADNTHFTLFYMYLLK